MLAGTFMSVLLLGGILGGLVLSTGQGDMWAGLDVLLMPRMLVGVLGAVVVLGVVGTVALYLLADRWIGAHARDMARELNRLAGKRGERGEPTSPEDEEASLQSALAGAARRLTQAQQEAEELARLRDRLARRDRSAETVHEIIKRINSSLEISQLRGTALRSLLTALNADFAAFLWIDSHQRVATLERVGRETGADRTLQHQLATLPSGRAEANSMLQRWQPWNWIALRLDNPDWQVLAADLVVAERFAGLVVALRSGEWSFSTEDEETFGIIVENLQVALENARLYELAIRDELTGLFTRRYFEQRAGPELSRCQRLRVPLSVVMIDLNRFKSVNDQLGHLTGDQLLAEVGNVIFSSVRNFDLPVRYGGDEFLLLLPNANTEQARLVAQRIERNFERIPPPRLHGPEQVGVALGIATFPDDATDTGGLVRLADQRMYQDKLSSRPAQQ